MVENRQNGTEDEQLKTSIAEARIRSNKTFHGMRSIMVSFELKFGVRKQYKQSPKSLQVCSRSAGKLHPRWNYRH